MKISSLKILSTSIALFTGFSVVGFAHTAKAEDIKFTGDVPWSCAFTLVNDGLLEENATKNGLNTSSTTPGKATITCNKASSKLTVNSLIQNTGVTTSNTFLVTIGGVGSGSITAVGAGGASTGLGLGVNEITATMTATTTGIIPEGNYSYTLNLTATQN